MKRKLILSIFFNIILFSLLTKRHFHKVTSVIYNSAILEKKYSKSLIDDDTYVLFTFGQSKAGNTAKDNYQPKHEVYNYYSNKLIKAVEPLRGCDVKGGISVWSRVSDLLIETKQCKKVVIIPIAVGGTEIDFWNNGEGSQILENTLKDLQENSIKITHILWEQGEANNGNSENYEAILSKIKSKFRQYNQLAPFYCSIATYQPNSKFEYGIDKTLQDVQKSFISNNEDVFIGSYSDSLTQAYYRYDGQHFSKKGNIEFAKLWVNALTKDNI